MRRMLLASAMIGGASIWSSVGHADAAPPRGFAEGARPALVLAAADEPSPAEDATEPKPMHHHHMMSQGEGGPHSDIAPKLPSPDVGANAGPRQYLMAAKRAMKAKRYGEAEQALEMAETRSLDRSVVATDANSPAADPIAVHIGAARQALLKKDYVAASAGIDAAASGMPGGEEDAMHKHMHGDHPHGMKMPHHGADAGAPPPPPAQ